MKRNFRLWQLMGFALSSIIGTFLHFLYDWLDKSIWVAPFSSVNESTWEHMKLIFWPMLFFAIIQSFFFKYSKSFWCVKLRGILLGLSLIPILFYTYNGVIGSSPDWINIAIFFISVGFAYIYETRLFSSTHCKSSILTFGTLCVIALLFFVFTFATPKIDLFIDPQTGNYGI